uniref:Uncharacterized protein n=1 Tax=Tetradesmus obliquus TaxID=3088 RepID=A0A383WPK7_TETOB
MGMINDGAPDKIRLYWFPALMPQQQQQQWQQQRRLLKEGMAIDDAAPDRVRLLPHSADAAATTAAAAAAAAAISRPAAAAEAAAVRPGSVMDGACTQHHPAAQRSGCSCGGALLSSRAAAVVWIMWDAGRVFQQHAALCLSAVCCV